jgi:hypothetical protein
MKSDNNISVEIGKSIIAKYYDYYEDEGLDDEAEFFPVLKIVIRGTASCIKNDSQRQFIENELKEYSKQLYVDLWLLHAEEDEEEMDGEYERKAAMKEFESIYRQV